MSKEVPLSAKDLFIVLTLPEKDISPLTHLQKRVASDYDLFPEGEFPELHITLNKVPSSEIKTAKQIVKQIAHEAPPIRIEINDFTCFDNDFLVLNVEETDSLLHLSAVLHSQLSRRDISTIKNYKEWKFHITLISDLLSEKSIPKFDFSQMCSILEGFSHPITTYAKSIELWRPTLDPKKKIIKSFPLISCS